MEDWEGRGGGAGETLVCVLRWHEVLLAASRTAGTRPDECVASAAAAPGIPFPACLVKVQGEYASETPYYLRDII